MQETNDPNNTHQNQGEAPVPDYAAYDTRLTEREEQHRTFLASDYRRRGQILLPLFTFADHLKQDGKVASLDYPGSMRRPVMDIKPFVTDDSPFIMVYCMAVEPWRIKVCSNVQPETVEEDFEQEQGYEPIYEVLLNLIATIRAEAGFLSSRRLKSRATLMALITGDDASGTSAASAPAPPAPGTHTTINVSSSQVEASSTGRAFSEAPHTALMAQITGGVLG